MPAADLPNTFTYTEARKAGLSKHALYRLRDSGQLEPIGRGLYRRHDAPLGDIDLLAVAQRSPMATLCLTSALARHDLTDLIPARHDIALPPRDMAPTWAYLHPLAQFRPQHISRWQGEDRTGQRHPDRAVQRRTVGCRRLPLPVSARHRNRARSSPPMAEGGRVSADLLQMSRRFPRTQTAIRSALEILI